MPSTSRGTNEGCSRATFECSGSDGAILAMPQGAYEEDLKNIRKFREYAFIHVKSWYLYVKWHLGIEVGNRRLHLVTGCDKTTSWGIATYSHPQSKCPEDNMSLLRFNPVGNERQGRHSSYTTYEWDYEGVGEAKSGPEEDELTNLGVDSSNPPRNQCTFIRSLTLALGDGDWKDVESDVASLVKDQASVQSPKSPFTSVISVLSSLPGMLFPVSCHCAHSNYHFQGCIGFLHGHSRGGSSEVTDSITPAQVSAFGCITPLFKCLLS